jgi:hypothetical protein
MDNFCTLESIVYPPKPPEIQKQKSLVKPKKLKDRLDQEDFKEINKVILSQDKNTFHLDQYKFNVNSKELLDSFKMYVRMKMKENKINNYHFCCNCKGFMINKK